MKNSELTSDQQQYISTLFKNRQRQNWGAALALIIISVISGYFSYTHITAVDDHWEELIFSVLVSGSTLFIGIKGAVYAFNVNVPQQKEVLNGVYHVRKKRHRRKIRTNYYLNNMRVMIPFAWESYFRKNESYTVEGVTGYGFLGEKHFIVLGAQHMPDLGFKEELMSMLEVKQTLVIKMLVYYLLIPLVVMAGLMGGAYFLFTDPDYQQKLGNILLNNSKSEIQLYALTLLLSFIGLGLIIKKIVDWITVSSTDICLPHSWKEWLQDYEHFLQTEMRLINPTKEVEREAFVRINEIVAKNKRFKLEYKKYKQQLRGHEKQAYIQAVRRLHVNLKKQD